MAILKATPIVQYAKAFGAQVIAIDEKSKKDFCFSVGADQFVDHHDKDHVDTVLKITKGGAHGVVVLASSVEAYQHGAEMLRIGGTLSVTGLPAGSSPINISIGKIIFKGLRIVGILVGSLQDHLEAVELTRIGKVRPVIKVVPFEQLAEVFQALDGSKIEGRVVVKIAADE